MDKAKELVINIIKELTHQTKNAEIDRLLPQDKIDWDGFKEFIIYHELATFAYLALRDSGSFLPQHLLEFLKNNYYCCLVYCQRLWQEFLRISMAFEQAKIKLLPLKGIALLEDIYSQRPLRPMTDIDLLVKEEGLWKAERIFQDLGYRKELYGLKEEYWREGQCHITFYKKTGVGLPFVELHWGLDFKRNGREVLPELWERIREIDMNGDKVKLLSPEDTLFSLALHTRRFGKTICLKNILDSILVLNKYGHNFDWDYCLNKSREYRLCATLFFNLYQVKLVSDVDIPRYVWKGLNLPSWKRRLIQRFIEKNMFLLQRNTQNKTLYLKAHFLLYDSLWEPIGYIINIPQEQFAKFYDLGPYDKKTALFYKMRLLYFPFRVMLDPLTLTLSPRGRGEEMSG